MAIVAHVILPGCLDESPAGGITHVTWWEAGDCHNVDAWSSEEAFNTFATNRLGPGMAKAGVHAEPDVRFHAAHEVYTPQSVTLTF